MHLTEADVAFATGMVDPVGRVFYHGGRVFRAIRTQESAAFVRGVLESDWIEDAFAAGLVRTWIPADVTMEGAALVVEHRRIPFTVYPAEFTARMHWEAARALVRVAIVLGRHGVYLKDAHPWNVMFDRGVPTLIDFGSLCELEVGRLGWLDEFRRYFAAPILLASRWMRSLAREYRREHGVGPLLRLFDSRAISWPLLLVLGGAMPRRVTLERFLRRLERWIVSHEPNRAGKERWGTYLQSAADEEVSAPAREKSRFVQEVLQEARPATVLDCAANKGAFSRMAAGLGASVVAFDYEEFCVDQCFALARGEGLDITPALMDFSRPTPASGLGLLCPDSLHRFRADVVLALGLCHHLCITQALPVEVFCSLCSAYATRGVVMEYVDPSDVHVAAWKRPVPDDYSIEGFSRFLQRRFPRRRILELPGDGGVKRTMLYFHT